MLDKIVSFYGFSKMPFGRDIAPGQLHRHHGHAEAVARLTWAITTRSLAVLTGEVGSGKTASVRAALAGTDPVRYRPVYLPNPAGIGIRGICQQIVIACGQAPRFHTGSLLPQAADALATEAEERGRTPILILDEAHQLDPGQLETIRMLTSYDLDSATCFAALLIGQPTLRTRLRLGVLAALDQRIALRAHSDGMTRQETASYISHHLALAGRGSDTLFSDDAITLWTPTGFVDTIRSGTMVYEERTGSGTGSQEVHPGI
jgi:type II secretory pathway predicted ATPase ExeA